ncbi:TadE/TadG family type IV pilus assembly protein [Paenibacillus sp. NRS-1760]|uniref:TadE/TadG family type IV pilus assembly protein n=1 Tax=Paenibacillus sp. NRS-1760 TaxID=3233902 RepID=UPI003D26A85C
MNRLRINAGLLRLLKKEQGSFTLESTIVFPMLFGLILLFILFGMYMYEKIIVYYAASSTAERAAFSWDNSNRDARSGMLNEPSYDGLYWRIGEDGVLSSLFGLRGENDAAKVVLPLAETGDGEKNALAIRKIEQSARWLGQAGLTYEGEISYSSSILRRVIKVKLKEPLSAESIEKSWLKREPKSAASSMVVDPTEFIRSVDLVRYYSSRFANRAGGAGQAKSQAGQVLDTYKGQGKATKP